MSRSRHSFFSNSSGVNESKHPLLSREYDSHNDVHLHDLPSPSASRASRASRASPSPPPEFYRDLRSPTSPSARTISPRPISESGSLSKMKGDRKVEGRRIQFTAPPPPIIGSVMGLGRGGISLDGSVHPNMRGSLVMEGRGVVGSLKSDGSSVGATGQLDNLLGLERRERALQAELQMLLDTQAEGLLQGFGGGGCDREEGSGSSTPTARSIQRSRDRQGNGSKDGQHIRAVPIRQPKKKTIGLRGARKWLLRDMGELVDVKGEEGDLLDEEMKTREVCMAKLEDWKTRIGEVKREIGEFVSSDIQSIGTPTSSLPSGSHESPHNKSEDRELFEFRTEERAVENEIREMEDRLLQMKARKNWLRERIKERVNQRESRLSSYRGALREVEVEVQEFLSRPPVMVSMSMGNEEGFMTLPPKRRTLEMAEEWWSKEIISIRARKVAVEKERVALEEGARYWEECMEVVMGFEDDLKDKMRNGQVGDVNGLKRQIGNMREVIRKLDDTARVAEKKGWNLLVAAVGAELQAFQQGEEILRGALKGMGGDIDLDPAENSVNQQKKNGDQEHHENNNTDTDILTDDSTDDALRELEADLAIRKSLLVEGRADVDRDEHSDEHREQDQESDEEFHLKELLVDRRDEIEMERNRDGHE